jgi:hypothetical protein
MATLSPKTPNENATYSFDLTATLGAMGTTIATISSISVSTGSVLSSSISSDALKINALLSGGSDGEEMKVTALFTTADGQTLEESFDVPVEAA